MRLFIADANAANRIALQMYLHPEPGIYVTGTAADARGKGGWPYLPVQMRSLA